MCELFAMSALHPASVTFSLGEFSQHGGRTGPHRDGWGIAYYEGRDVRIIREPEPASDSLCAGAISQLDLASPTVISHIRKATHGGIALANTQPFARELGGHQHVFAHNGELDGVADAAPLGRFLPVGETDSEHAFCSLLHRLEPLWRATPGRVPALADRWKVVSELAERLRPLGPFNFLYADGDALFVHGHKRRQGGKGPMVPPGLHTLCRSCPRGDEHLDVPGLQIDATTDEPQRVMLVASVPLTDEAWEPAPTGEVIVLRDGRRLDRLDDRAPARAAG